MPVLGEQLQPSQIARLLHAEGFRDFDLVEMVATCLSESMGYVHAFNDNVDDGGRTKSRDVGLFQINIPARQIGTIVERRLYDPRANARAARKLFDTRQTLTKRRRFQPWYGYTLGWATFPQWWVFTKLQKPRHWAPTGRFLHRAIVGVANFYAEEMGVDYPRPFVQLPAAPVIPSKPPRGDGPRPVKNSGRGILG